MKTRIMFVLFFLLILLNPFIARSFDPCNANDLVVRNPDNNGQTCKPVEYVFPSGTLLPYSSGSSCPTGFTEATDLDTRFLLGTTIANGTVGDTGGSNTITPTFTGNQITFTTQNNFGLIGAASALTSPTSITPSGTISSFNPTPLYKKVIWCRRN